MPWCAASTASPYVPILFAVSPFAAIRSAPVRTQSTSPAAIRDAAAASAMTVCGIPALSSSHARRRLVGILAARDRERVPVRGSDPDRGRAADGERANRLGDVRGRAADELDLLVGQAPLVEDDDGVALEPDDSLRGQLGHVRGSGPRTCPQQPRPGVRPSAMAAPDMPRCQAPGRVRTGHVLGSGPWTRPYRPWPGVRPSAVAAPDKGPMG